MYIKTTNIITLLKRAMRKRSIPLTAAFISESPQKPKRSRLFAQLIFLEYVLFGSADCSKI